MGDCRTIQRAGNGTRALSGLCGGRLGAAGVLLAAAWAFSPAVAATGPEGAAVACAEGRAPCPALLCAGLPSRCAAECAGDACLPEALCTRVANRCALAPAGRCARDPAGGPSAPCGDGVRCGPWAAAPELAGTPSRHLHRNPLGASGARRTGPDERADAGRTPEPDGGPGVLTVASAGSADAGGAGAGDEGAGPTRPLPSGRQVVGPLGALLDPAAVGSGAPALMGGLGPPPDPDPNVLHPCDNPGSGCGISFPQVGPGVAPTGSSSPDSTGVVEAPAKPFQFPPGGGAPN